MILGLGMTTWQLKYSCNFIKHETSIQCCYNIEPASQRVIQHYNNRESSQCGYLAHWMCFHLTNKYLSIQKYKSPVRKCSTAQILAQAKCASMRVKTASTQVRKWESTSASVQVLSQVCKSAQVLKYLRTYTSTSSLTHVCNYVCVSAQVLAQVLEQELAQVHKYASAQVHAQVRECVSTCASVQVLVQVCKYLRKCVST